MGEQTAVDTIRARLQTLTGPARSGGTRDMAELLGMPLPNVTRYVRGNVSPPHDFLVAVADRYNVSLDWLYGRSQSGGVKDSEQAEPAWARRLDARLRHLERKVGALSGGPELSVEEIVRIAVEAARRPRRAAATRVGDEAPDPTAGDPGAAVR